tara:strand:- start:1080 stop:1265 length:186 start_codon:yes stop_codon:yes gene_type:complete
MDLEEERKRMKAMLAKSEVHLDKLNGIVDSIMVLLKGLNNFEVNHILQKMDFEIKYNSKID